jgi:uncharacterized repeat protein (TIGR01451 family)
MVITGQLHLGLAAYPSAVLPGQALTVSLRLTNTGSLAAQNVTLTAFLPPALE